jgi:hypothetical protein
MANLSCKLKSRGYSVVMDNKKLFLSLAVAAACVPIFSDILVFGTTGKAERIVPVILGSPMSIALAAVPFIVSAFVWPHMRRGALAGIIAFIITLIPWAQLTYGGWMTQSGHNMGGADIGTGLILLALPFFLTPLIRLLGGAPQLNNPS